MKLGKNVKLGKKRWEEFKRNYYIISPRVIIKAIITRKQNNTVKHVATVRWPATQRNDQSSESFTSLHNFWLVCIASGQFGIASGSEPSSISFSFAQQNYH